MFGSMVLEMFDRSMVPRDVKDYTVVCVYSYDQLQVATEIWQFLSTILIF